VTVKKLPVGSRLINKDAKAYQLGLEGKVASLNEKAGPISARSAKQSGLDFLKSLNHIKSRLCQPRNGKAYAA